MTSEVMVGICLAVLCVASLIASLACKIAEQKSLIRRQAARISRSGYLRTEQHAKCWVSLWEIICERYNIHRWPDGTWHGGQAAKEIYKIMRTEFGKFDEEQILFIKYLAVQLRNVTDAQHKTHRRMLVPSLN